MAASTAASSSASARATSAAKAEPSARGGAHPIDCRRAISPAWRIVVQTGNRRLSLKRGGRGPSANLIKLLTNLCPRLCDPKCIDGDSGPVVGDNVLKDGRAVYDFVPRVRVKRKAIQWVLRVESTGSICSLSCFVPGIFFVSAPGCLPERFLSSLIAAPNFAGSFLRGLARSRRSRLFTVTSVRRSILMTSSLRCLISSQIFVLPNPLISRAPLIVTVRARIPSATTLEGGPYCSKFAPSLAMPPEGRRRPTI